MPGMAETRHETQARQTVKQGMVMGSARSRVPMSTRNVGLAWQQIFRDDQMIKRG